MVFEEWYFFCIIDDKGNPCSKLAKLFAIRAFDQEWKLYVIGQMYLIGVLEIHASKTSSVVRKTSACLPMENNYI